MYLLTFVVLIVSLIGLYAQILTVQVTRLAGQQSAIGHAMMDWHNAAVSMAASILKTNPAYYDIVTFPDGCTLSPSQPLPTSQACPGPINKTVDPATPLNSIVGGGLVIPGNQIAVCPPTSAGVPCDTTNGWKSEDVHLPTGSAGAYQFYSILYQTGAAGSNLVVTFVLRTTANAANPAGLLTLADGTQIGLSAADLMHQLSNASGRGVMFGYMTDNTVGQPPVVHAYQEANATVTAPTVAFQYKLPSTASFICTALPCVHNGVVFDGAVAIVSQPDGL